ncbi:MAG: hypothetical protein QW835_00125 [Candidatus Hadarchaeum sp.]
MSMVMIVVRFKPRAAAKKVYEFTATVDGILGPLGFIKVMPSVYLGPPAIGLENIIRTIERLTLAREVLSEIIFSRHVRRRQMR